MRFVLLVFALFFSLASHAQYAAKDTFRVYILNPEMRFERDGSQDVVDRKPLNFALGYKRQNIGLALEYARFKENSGNETSSFERVHQDFLLWMKFHFLGTLDREINMSLFAGPGAGFYQENVTTSFMGQERSDGGGSKFVAGFVAGGEFVRAVNQDFAVLAGLEARAFISSEFESNYILGAVLRFGIQVPFKY